MTEDKKSTPPRARDDEDDRTRIAPLPAEDTEGEVDDRTLLVPLSENVPGQPIDANATADDRTILSPTAMPELSTDNVETVGAAAIAATQIKRAETLTASIGSDGSQAMPQAGSAMQTLEPGMVINNMYRVEERIDNGGMGRVFRGIEIGTGEAVAIKVILPEMAEDPRVAQMFRREARTLRQLHHDAIVRYFAYVPPDTNFKLHALVMGFIEGTKLSDKIKSDGPLSKDQVCQLFLRLADGLERAHSIGVVHRDLSPDNVMLPDNDISRALLIDFGISRSSKLPEGTLGNEFAGKLKYVSPEQLGAYGGDAEAPSDVYSLALLMIVTLTGKALAMGDSIVEAVQKRQSVPDLSQVPGPFQTLLYQMLQPDPAQRVRSMADVIAGLNAIAGGEAPTSAPIPPVQTNIAVPGLQAAPQANAAGQGMVTNRPAAAGPSKTTSDEGGGFAKVLGILLILSCVGGGAWYAMGMPGLPTAPVAQEGNDPETTRIVGIPETFLAENAPTPCSFATYREQGTNAGMIEGFAEKPEAWGDIQSKYNAAFSAQSGLVTQTISPAQCVALEVARDFQGTNQRAIELVLDRQKVSRQEGVVGAIHGTGDRKNWLALVSPSGRVFSLMGQLAQPIGEQRGFSFRLPSAQPGTYLLIATASENALIRAGAMADGTQAAELLPLIASELAKDGQGVFNVAVVDLSY